MANPREEMWRVVDAGYDPRWLEGVSNDLLMRFAVLVAIGRRREK